jgi:serine/threonine protein kinase
MTLSPGSKLGPYEILSAIGSGGMGEVWKARDTRLGRIVAIKKVREQHSERFKQEARSIAALNHPNIWQIFDIGNDYLVLEYVEGKPLSSPLPEQEAVKLAIQIGAAEEESGAVTGFLKLYGFRTEIPMAIPIPKIIDNRSIFEAERFGN